MGSLKARLGDRDLWFGLALIAGTVSMLAAYGHHIRSDRAHRVMALEKAYLLGRGNPVTQELRPGRDRDCEKVIRILTSHGYSMLMNNEPIAAGEAAIEFACHSRTKSLTYWKSA